jgi:hypothetical protein
LLPVFRSHYQLTIAPRKLVETAYLKLQCLGLELDGCQSGRLGTPGKRVYRKVPRVRIPPHPPLFQKNPNSVFDASSFSAAKEPDRPAIILFRYSDFEDESSISEFRIKRVAMNRDKETALLRAGETKYVADHEVATMFVVLSSLSRRCSALFGLVCQPRGCGAGRG